MFKFQPTNSLRTWPFHSRRYIFALSFPFILALSLKVADVTDEKKEEHDEDEDDAEDEEYVNSEDDDSCMYRIEMYRS